MSAVQQLPAAGEVQSHDGRDHAAAHGAPADGTGGLSDAQRRHIGRGHRAGLRLYSGGTARAADAAEPGHHRTSLPRRRLGSRRSHVGDRGRRCERGSMRPAKGTITTTARSSVPRATSPAGITPTGQEVHAYVSGAERIDVVLFTATQTGTFVVQCDLHPEHVGKLTVFDRGRPSGRIGGLSAPAAGTGACAGQGSRIGGLPRRVGRARRCHLRHCGVRRAGTGRSSGCRSAGAGAARRVPGDGADSHCQPPC